MLSRFGEPLVRPLVAAQPCRILFRTRHSPEVFRLKKCARYVNAIWMIQTLCPNSLKGCLCLIAHHSLSPSPTPLSNGSPWHLQLEQRLRKYTPRTTAQTNFMSKPGFNDNKRPFTGKQPQESHQQHAKYAKSLISLTNGTGTVIAPNRNKQANKPFFHDDSRQPNSFNKPPRKRHTSYV